MKRNFVRAAAVVGAASLSMLVAGPSMAATAPVSQATAQALQLSLVGNPIISQLVAASNNGTTETWNNSSTIPPLATVLPTTNVLGVGVAIQDARANADGTSAACAGVAGPASTGSVANIGPNGCLNSANPLSLTLGNLQLGTAAFDSTSAVTAALAPLLSQINPVIPALQTNLINAINNAVRNTPLALGLGGSLGAISADCQATPTTATGDSFLLNSNISLTVPGQQPIVLTSLPAHPAPNTQVVVNPAGATQAIETALLSEITNAIQGQLAPLATTVLAPLVQQIQTALVTQIQPALQPLLQPLQQNVLSLTLNEQQSPISGQAQPSISVTAFDLSVLPVLGNGGLSLKLGHVTCGPNTKAATVTPPAPSNPAVPAVPAAKLPKQVNSGEGAGQNILLGGTAALLAMSGGLGLMAYRRYWMPRG